MTDRVQKFADVGDAALDAVYHYGLAAPGSFGSAANRGTAEAVLSKLDAGERDVEALAEAAHVGWGNVALTFDDPVYEAKPQKRAARLALANTKYSDLPDDEKEKDRVVARALLAAYNS